MANALSILIVEDEAGIRSILRDAIRGEAGRVIEARTAEEAIDRARGERPDLVLLDLGLPDLDGLEVCRSIRTWSSAPIIVISARHSDQEKVTLLDAGADDYLTKPFSALELQARVRAQLRRARMGPVPGGDAPLTLGRLVIDLAARTIVRAGQPIHLTPIEWDLLRALVTRAGRTLTHQRLFTAVWGNGHGDAQQYLRVYIAHLRRKIEEDPLRPRLILTESGVGYRFELGASDAKPEA